MSSHLQNERDAELKSDVFDATLTQARPQHDLYSKAVAALAEAEACNIIQSRLASSEAGSIMLHGVNYVLHADGQPDKPGTVRRPGVRRQPQGSMTKQRWAKR